MYFNCLLLSYCRSVSVVIFVFFLNLHGLPKQECFRLVKSMP